MSSTCLQTRIEQPSRSYRVKPSRNEQHGPVRTQDTYSTTPAVSADPSGTQLLTGTRTGNTPETHRLTFGWTRSCAAGKHRLTVWRAAGTRQSRSDRTRLNHKRDVYFERSTESHFLYFLNLDTCQRQRCS